MNEHDDELGPAGYSPKPILAFDTDDPEFTRGFEAGRLWEQVKADAAPFEQTIHASNAEMAMRICEAQERDFRADILDEHWVEIHVG